MVQDGFAAMKKVLLGALEIPPDERAGFLTRVCRNDVELRRDVEDKLALADRDPSLLATWGLQLAAASGAATVADSTAADENLNRLVSHYRLEAFIGAGAMGHVYRATDLALGRRAAVKLLRPDVGADQRERLVREGRTVARLTHPAIAQFFDSGVCEGIEFLAMELVDGESLNDRLARGPLEAADALDITAAILEALVHAHEAGFLHRDIKPANVVLTVAGTPKLLDFGIAKKIANSTPADPGAATVAATPELTMHGTLLGTPGYMSPEQIQGRPLDARTDIFAMGAVLHEMLAGEPAFPGATWRDRLEATRTREISPIGRDDLPADISVILSRALARDPDARYPTAAAFLSELRRLMTDQTVSLLPNTLAVLDPANLQGAPDDDWIGTGVAESLNVDLRRARGLELVPRDRVVKARRDLDDGERQVDPVALGLTLSCRWVLAGSFQRAGDALRLSVRLVDVSTGQDLWSEKVDGSMDDLFSIHDRLAKLIAESLSAILPEDIERRAVPDLDVFEHYVRARGLILTWERGGMEQALEHLERALDLDPRYAPALAWMAGYHAPGRWHISGDARSARTALEFADRAVAADPTVGDGHMYRGYALWRLEDLDAAVAALKSSVEVDETCYLGWYFLGCCLSDRGDWPEAIDALQQGLAIEPNAPWLIGCIANALLAVGDVQSALWSTTRAVEVERGPAGFAWSGAGIFHAEVLRRSGRLEESRETSLSTLHFIESTDGFNRSPFRPLTLAVLGRVLLDLDDLDGARVAFDQGATVVREQPAPPLSGHALVQCLAGLTRCGAGPEPYETGRELMETRQGYSFAWGGYAGDNYTLFELARAAQTLGRAREAQDLLDRARAAGSTESWD